MHVSQPYRFCQGVQTKQIIVLDPCVAHVDVVADYWMHLLNMLFITFAHKIGKTHTSVVNRQAAGKVFLNSRPPRN